MSPDTEEDVGVYVKLQLPREEVAVVELLRLSVSRTLYVLVVSLIVPVMVIGLSVDAT